jgi:hypothetical protein
MNATVPHSLFKYVRPNPAAVQSLFGHLLIRYTPPSRFNDPFDISPYIEPPRDADWQHSVIPRAEGSIGIMS